MYVAICEDEKMQQELVKQQVEQWALIRGEKVQIAFFDNSEQFLFYWSERKDIDLILLDIEMGEMDGISLAKQIRKVNEEIQIIFITGIKDYIAEGYEVNAMHYLIKPIEKERLFSCLDKVKAREKSTSKKIILETTDGLVSVMINDIWCIEASKHHCMVKVGGNLYEVKQSFGQLEQMDVLKEFLKCHRSYLVNIKYIAKVEKKQLILDDGQILPVSRSVSKQIVEAFINYYHKGNLEESIL